MMVFTSLKLLMPTFSLVFAPAETSRSTFTAHTTLFYRDEYTNILATRVFGYHLKPR